MNLVDTVVEEILEPPVHHVYPEVQYWTVKVRANCYGQRYITDISCKTQAEAEAIKVGYKWLT